MTPGRVTALVLGVPVAVALICAIAISIVAEFGEDSIHVDQAMTLPAQTAGVTVDGLANMTLHTSTGVPGRVQVRGTVRGAFVRPAFGLRRTARGVVISNSCSVPTGTCSGDLDVQMTVPPGLPIVASNTNGDLTASALNGQVTLSDGSGDLRASQLSGTLALSDSTGALIASSLSGASVRLSSSSADITGSGISGDSVTLSDTTGDITITGLAANTVTGSADSGNVTLTFTKVPRRVKVTDTAGDITLVLPSGPAYYEVNAQTTTGNLSIGGVRRRSSSPYVITATTGSGNITIMY